MTGIRWKYLLAKKVDGRQETREIVETKSGSLDRLIAMAGRPLTEGQQHEETERILKLSHDPEEQRQRNKLAEKMRNNATGFFR